MSISDSAEREEGNEVAMLRRRVAQLEDVEERCQQLQRDLNASEGMFRSIVANLPDIIYRLDASGTITFISDNVRLHGYAPEELIGTHIMDWVHPEDRDRAEYRVNERRTGERSVRQLELRLFPRSEAVFEVRSTAIDLAPTFLVAAEGVYHSDIPRAETFLGTQGIARDITETKLAEEALHLQATELAGSHERLQEKERLVAAFHRIGQATLASLDLDEVLDALSEQIIRAGILRSLMIALVNDQGDKVEVVRNCVRAQPEENDNPEGTVILWNRETRGATYDLQDENITALVARTGEMRVVEGWDETFDEFAGRPELRQGQIAYFVPIKKESQVLAVLATGSGVEEKGEVLHRIEVMQPLLDMVAIALEHARLYRRLVESEERALQAQKMEAVGQLTAGITHNFNNMLTAINGSLQLIQMDAPDVIQAQLETAVDATGRAAEMVKQLQLFGRKGKIAIKAVDPYAIVHEVVEICRKLFDRKLEITVESRSEPTRVWGDAVQIEQVILNLCLNARDALEGVVEVEHIPRICLRLYLLEAAPGELLGPDTSEGRYVCIEVADNGVGMDEELRQHIFEPFFTTKEPDRGTGLGLATVYGIVRQHEGWIECESEPGKGTTFSVYLPVAPEEREAALDPERELRKGTETILVIEDEEGVRRTMKRILERYGFTVLEAADGREGLAVFERERKRISLVILDRSMPRMSGEELLIELRQRVPQAKLVLCTGYAPDGYEPEGVQMVLRKPFGPRELVGAVCQVLDG